MNYQKVRGLQFSYNEYIQQKQNNITIHFHTFSPNNNNNQLDGYGLQVLVTCVFLMVPSINWADTATCWLGHPLVKYPLEHTSDDEQDDDDDDVDKEVLVKYPSIHLMMMIIIKRSW